MLHKFYNLIADYQQSKDEILTLFRTKYNCTCPVTAFRMERITQEGQLDLAGKITFYFAGNGCNVNYNGKEIDFEWGIGNDYGGFDAWRLLFLARSQPEQYPEYQEIAMIDLCIRELMVKGELTTPHGASNPSILYFRKDLEQVA